LERRVTKTRRAICYIAVRKQGYKCDDISKTLGMGEATPGKAVSLGSKPPETAKIQRQIRVK
jgi:transposase